MKIGCHWDLTPAQTSLRNFLLLSTALTPYESPRLPSQFPTAVLFLFTSPLWFQSSVLTWLTCEKVSNWSSCSAVCLFVVVVVFFFFGCIMWHVGFSFPNQESNLHHLQWKPGFLTTGLAGKPLCP